MGNRKKFFPPFDSKESREMVDNAIEILRREPEDGEAEAEALLKKGVEDGNPRAMYNLGVMLMRRNQSLADLKKAWDLYSNTYEIIDRRRSDAEEAAGKRALDPYFSVEQKVLQSALVNLGCMSQRGLGVPVDHSYAWECWSYVAADNALAKFFLGCMLIDGTAPDQFKPRVNKGKEIIKDAILSGKDGAFAAFDIIKRSISSSKVVALTFSKYLSETQIDDETILPSEADLDILIDNYTYNIVGTDKASRTKPESEKPMDGASVQKTFNVSSLKDFGACLRAWRSENKYNQTQAAARIGIAQGDVSDFERGKGNPTWSTIKRIIDVIGVVAIIPSEENAEEKPAPAAAEM